MPMFSVKKERIDRQSPQPVLGPNGAILCLYFFQSEYVCVLGGSFPSIEILIIVYFFFVFVFFVVLAYIGLQRISMCPKR